MKLCLLCGKPSPISAVTCPNDGEATWGPLAGSTPEPALLVAEQAEPVATRKPARKPSR